MESNIILTFADLHTDILFHVCRFLDKNSICCLVNVCKSLKEKLYHPVIRRNTVLASSDVNEATAESLKIRNIRTVMLSPEVNCSIPVRRSLVNMAATGTLENLIIQWRIPALHNSSCQCSDRSLLRLESLKCLVISLEGSTLESLLKRQLYRNLLSASNLCQMLIPQQVSSSPNVVIGEVEHLGQMKLPPDLDFKYVLADCSGTVIKPGQELRCPGLWNH